MKRQTGRNGQEHGVPSESPSLGGASQWMAVSGPLHEEQTTLGHQEIKMRGPEMLSKRAGRVGKYGND